LTGKYAKDITRPRISAEAEEDKTLNEIEKTAAAIPLITQAMIANGTRLRVQKERATTLSRARRRSSKSANNQNGPPWSQQSEKGSSPGYRLRRGYIHHRSGIIAFVQRSDHNRK